MREIKNILFRRILYKIPLKFLLILFAIVAIFIASFSSAGYSVATITDNNSASFSISGYNTFCFFITASLSNNCLDLTYNNTHLTYLTSPGNPSRPYCDLNNSSNSKTFTITNTCGSNKSVWLYYVDYSNGYTCSNMTSLECQNEYNLIPISSVDSTYCQNNNLCPSSGGGDCSGGVYSNVYVNNILHVGAPNIIMNIPEEIDWDYAYSSGGNNMNIDIVGYNVDYDYINGQYDIQNFKPDSEDLSNIVSSILPLFIPGLVIILFLYFLFKFIKKIF